MTIPPPPDSPPSLDDVLHRAARVVDAAARRGRSPRKRGSDTPPATGGLAGDSLAKINLIIAIEEEFGCEIDEGALPPSTLDTVLTLARFVHAQLQGR